MFAIQSLLIALLTTFSASGSAPIGGYPLKYLFQRPFIGGLLVGIILGDVQKGIIVGCAMQLVYIGYFQVGGVGSMDMGIISFPCVAIAVKSGIETIAAIALATGLATAFTSIDYVVRIFCVMCGDLMKKSAEKGDWKGFTWGYVGLPTIFYLIERGLTSFLLVYFGAGAIEALVAALPAPLMTALSRVASFLPAIGMAALMGYLVDDIWGIMFFVFGFAMNGYLGLSTTAIIFPAVIIAYLYYRTISNKTSGETVKGEIASEEEII